MTPSEKLTRRLQAARRPALVAFLTAGYPERDAFLSVLADVAAEADAVEIGVPFSDPMADGITIQRSSRAAIEQGVSLRWILDELARRPASPTPLLLMSYLNPLLAFGYEALAERAADVGVSGFIVPDLPFEESAPLRGTLDERGLALVQLVTPATPPERLAQLCAASQGFVYAVTRTGITGGAAQAALPDIGSYLRRVKGASTLPVCAGFGVRSAHDAARIGADADGVIVGSALIEILERGESPGDFLRGLRAEAPPPT